MRDIGKSFGAITALRSVSLAVHAGEAIGVLGDNGAGKSTLMKILAGSLQRDSGVFEVDGAPVAFQSPRDSRAAGIEMIYQDLALCDELDVASNFFLGREPRRFGLLDIARMHAEAAKGLAALGSRIPSTWTDIKSLSGGQRQTVAIGRALTFNPRVLIMDEPTAALGVREAAAVIETIRRVKAKGVAVILISHRLQDVLDVCDTAILISEGRSSAPFSVPALTAADISRIVLSGRVEREAAVQ
ncbi:sugar ABC transporter ATP-binding protein [Methylobrevis sp. L22]|uniref:Sugar ABC transporter ATP-binding protein n=1 Tax=Methylobrevis albus TaxID=2793297 RepID=A0A931I4R3_9HYPH|nr:sugar ABC transporter ATP-binding protein [Methylobrevis albus]